MAGSKQKIGYRCNKTSQSSSEEDEIGADEENDLKRKMMRFRQKRRQSLPAVLGPQITNLGSLNAGSRASCRNCCMQVNESYGMPSVHQSLDYGEGAGKFGAVNNLLSYVTVGKIEN